MMSRDLTNTIDQSGVATNHPFLRKLIADGGFHFDDRFGRSRLR